MKIIGIILIGVGILMCVFTSVNFTQKKKVADLGPIEINKTENKTIAWPVFAGIGIGVLGTVLVVLDAKKSS
jgi:uncharacterized membrane protein YidH (DUF202 family)